MCKNKADLDKKIAKRRKLVALKKKIDDQIKDVDHDIIEYVIAKGVLGGKDGTTRRVYGDGYKVSYLTITKHTLDSDRLKEVFGDQLNDFQVLQVSNRLDIR